MDSSTHPLLVPRWKVIQDYPGCPYEMGTVLIADSNGELYSPIYGYTSSFIRIMQSETEKFKHLVELLPWYAERKPEELTGYIKIKTANGEWHVYEGNILDKDWVKWKFGGIRQDEFLPATAEEYNAYLQSQTK